MRPHEVSCLIQVFNIEAKVNKCRAHSTLLGVPSCVRFCQQEFGEFPRLVGCYCSYLLPKQAGGTPQILVDKTSRMTGCLRVYLLHSFYVQQGTSFAVALAIRQQIRQYQVTKCLDSVQFHNYIYYCFHFPTISLLTTRESITLANFPPVCAFPLTLT